ncbi:hypothetical protein Q7P37_003067 [Cladosporium fusiforme]
MSTRVDRNDLRCIFHHVFLPPRLPQSTDDESSDFLLLTESVNAFRALKDTIPDSLAVKHALAALENLRDVNSLPGCTASESMLSNRLMALDDGYTVPTHSRSQNAAVLITRKDKKLIFEEFELSPRNEAVIATTGRLVRTFPGHAVEVALGGTEEADFISTVANLLATMCQQPVPRMQPQSKKARGHHNEIRDTTHPAIISELFFGFLKGFGKPVAVPAISKKTREDVLWKDAAAPWRRSPMWLLIRVVLQLTLERASDGSPFLYKQAMVFIMSHILQSSLEQGFAADVLYVMSAKIVRRLCKFHNSTKDKAKADTSPVVKHVRKVLASTSSVLSKHWNEVQQQDSQKIDLDHLPKLRFEADTHVALPSLDKHIERINSRKHDEKFVNFLPTSGLIRYTPEDLPQLSDSRFSDDCYAIANLEQFEQWIDCHLEKWTLSNKQDNDCEKLHRLLVEYHNFAGRHYEDNPEALSVMLLTILELWIACDKIATRIEPLLANYNPGIPLDALQCLLLPFHRQMERLTLVEQYIQQREQQSHLKNADMLLDMSRPEGFANRYFAQSPTHQSLKHDILRQAEDARKAKKVELERLRDEYRRLNTLYNNTQCAYITVVVDDRVDPPETTENHRHDCQKCLYRVERDALEINVHEWPLPEDVSEAQAVVFELDVPSWLAHWRDARLHLLQDVLKGEREEVILSRGYRLSQSDPHLSHRYFKGPTNHRIDLFSESKPFTISHYRSKKVNTALQATDVCVANGLQYQYYDAKTRRYTGGLYFPDTVSRSCTYTLSNRQLQKYIFRPSSSPDGPPPNWVIAGQDSCPCDMSLEEYKELASIPLGHHIHWPNMMLQMAMPGVDFRKSDTTLVFLQCIYQSGPPNGKVLRESHDIFSNDAKTTFLVDRIEVAIDRVKQNWESAQGLILFVTMLTRSLSLNVMTASKCFELLERAREIALEWTYRLRERAHAASNHQDHTFFVSKSVETAMICTSTFDVHETHMPATVSSMASVSALVQSAIVVQQGIHASTFESQSWPLLFSRHQRTLCRIYKLLLRHQSGLDDAVGKSWSAYVPSRDGWAVVSDVADNWFTTKTAAGLEVHYNSLDGELLVNGLPLDQPPKQYREQKLYSNLFGRALVEVMPASSPGFQFSTKRRFQGCEVQIGMRASESQPTDLLMVRTFEGGHSTDEHGTFETIPRHLLAHKFPESFVENTVHWYNYGTGNIEFRPICNPWISGSTANWVLVKDNRCQAWRLSRGPNTVVGLEKETSIAIARILCPLSPHSRIHCIWEPLTQQLRVDIPTLRLSFYLEKGASLLRSKEFSNMSIDRSQYIGTLSGFENKLVLTSARGKRLLLLKESALSYFKTSSHIVVSVDHTSVARVHGFRIDSLLKRLVDNGDLQCKLYLAYLHALTSSCLPDPFLGVTGTEQALSILRSAAVRSFAQLSQENVDTLGRIARLSHSRQYYPTHLRVMQSVSWDPQVQPLAQHPELRIQVQEIFEQARKTAIFYPELDLRFSQLPRLDEHLRDRDMIRDSSFRVSGFGAENHTDNYDDEYHPRDRNVDSESAKRVAVIAGLMYRTGHDKHWEAPTVDQLWQTMCTLSEIQGSESLAGKSDLRYDAAYLDKGLEFVLARLPSIQLSLKTPRLLGHPNFAIMGWFAGLIFPLNDMDCRIIQVLAMFYKSAAIAHIKVPSATSFRVRDGKQCSLAGLKRIIQNHVRKFTACPEHGLERRKNEKYNAYHNRRHQAWQSSSSSAVEDFTRMLQIQWPCSEPVLHLTPLARIYIEVERAMNAVRDWFKIWHDNLSLYEYLGSITSEMIRLQTSQIDVPKPVKLSAQRHSSLCGYIATQDLFSMQAPQLPVLKPGMVASSRKETAGLEERVPRLKSLITAMNKSCDGSAHQQTYNSDLQRSLDAMLIHGQDSTTDDLLLTREISGHLKHCEDYVAQAYSLLTVSASRSLMDPIACHVQQRPRLSPMLFLQQLSHILWDELPASWRGAIIVYGVALTSLQRAERLSEYSTTLNYDGFKREIGNTGHTNWSPCDHPASLLMEIESGILIRDIQEDIGRQMRSPDSCRNAVMQLNMGEGKSSVIAPMVATTLADGLRLVRVIVGKPQSKQMAQMLISKLGGLVDRRIYYLPVSRALAFDRAATKEIDSMLRECMARRGILLLQPEHLLSFKLMAPECYISGRDEIGQQLMCTQDFLDQYARDIVDESDENFNVRFELIYTMGAQNLIEMSPDRWNLAQKVYAILNKVAPIIVQETPESLEINSTYAGGFPRIRILHPEVGVTLVHRIAQDICKTGIGKLQVARQPKKVRDAVFSYITKIEIDDNEINAVEDGPIWTDTTKASLLLLRGMLAEGVLVFCLSQKRWRVNYGLASRKPTTRLAVPYSAKDSPSLRSEFSHPDVVIMLTSLCYYYQGLDDNDLFAALTHLIDSDQADIEYQSWVEDASELPFAFKQLQGVNLKDRPQCVAELFPALRRGKSTVDYFLSHIVFPKEMREFPKKLSASGWDIGKQKTQLVTGFSGTNDAKYLLPLDVEQLDLQQQKHTNAMVLEYLLQDGNSVELLTPNQKGLTDANSLLISIVQFKPEVQVILDVGAQILELTNLDLATTWLQLSKPSKEAVVFVNDEDELCVVDRDGRVDLLPTSPFASRLDSCLVFLDESHTRGIDLRLPKHYKAAVTLGASLTKDRLIQACMRMRQLGKGQTVAFCVPLEIQAKIRDMKQTSDNEITVSDVILWAISETHREMRRSMPLWAVQGQRFIKHQGMWRGLMKSGKTMLCKTRAEDFLEEESQTLEHRYLPRSSQYRQNHSVETETADYPMKLIADRCHQFGGLPFGSRVLYEEQERELSPEIEQERQVQGSPPATPAVHHLHPNVKLFALSTAIQASSIGYMTAFESLSHLSMAKDFDLRQLATDERLLVSTDFSRTVKESTVPGACDVFQRHVTWLLTKRSDFEGQVQCIMAISPYEANLLHPHMKGSSNRLSIFKPRTNSGYAALDDMAFYTVTANGAPLAAPRSLLAQLGLFAGQLYMTTYADYLEICRFLGLSERQLTDAMEHEGWQVDVDGFILRDAQGQIGGKSNLTSSPHTGWAHL